ncbi:MFS transporter [Candidatus Gracilibacteria bacterium]|nr:MFS transporter [Candidatus Gracilibacteria bacterium]
MKINIKEHPKEGLIKIIQKKFFSLPISIKMVSFSFFIFMLGWGLGADTFFSVYVKTIVDNIFWVSIIGAILAGAKMIFTLPIGELDDHTNMKYVIFLSKIFYAIAAIFYFFAGVFFSIEILLVAVIFNGIATASLLVTYQTYIRHRVKKNNSGTSFGLFFSSANLALVLGSLLVALFIDYIDLHYVFIFLFLFSILSLFTDNKLPEFKDKRLKEIFQKESFLHQFFRSIFSFGSFKRVFETLRNSSKKLIGPISFEFAFNALNYIGFLFIPIVSIQNNLSLAQIAIIVAVMRAPYLIGFFSGSIADKFNKKAFVLLIFLFLSFMYTLLGYNEGFRAIITISFGIALGLAAIRPVISGLISDNVKSNDIGTITGVGEFTGRLGDIFGAIIFGILSGIIGISGSFIFIGIALFVISLRLLLRSRGFIGSIKFRK